MRTLLTVSVLGLLGLMLATGGQAAAGEVSLQAQIDRAQPGDTLTIDGGVYHENIVIDKPLILEGQNDPVIDGGGNGDVVTITADNVTLSRFVVRNSGRAVSQEPAAIKVDGTHATIIKDNKIESSHFGIHMTGSHHPELSYNQIDLGADTPVERRGHAIYFWEVSEGIIHSNTIRNAADGIHLEFSDDTGIAENTVTHSRYALHFMYANNNRILSNNFTDNLSGAVVMFSKELLLKDNDFSNNRGGAMGVGILLKDVDNIFVEGNRIIRNKYGLRADGVPQSVGSTGIFMRNLFALNDIGLGLATNAPITFVENAMIENTVQVQSLGGDLLAGTLAGDHATAPAASVDGSEHAGHEGFVASTSTDPSAPASAAQTLPQDAVWSIGGRGNYWSDYKGYDANSDGVGDNPYRPEPPFAGGLSGNESLRLFQFTLAQQAVDAAADMFPLYRYKAVIEDAGPLMSPPGPAMPNEGGFNKGLFVVSILLVVLAAAVVQTAFDFDPLTALWAQGRRAAGYLREGQR